jgi:hypothetical protein
MKQENPNDYSVTIDGRLFTATRAAPSEAWDVTYPEGQFRHHGSKNEIAIEIRKVARTLAA